LAGAIRLWHIHKDLSPLVNAYAGRTKGRGLSKEGMEKMEKGAGESKG
jgi:hypothetical protein